MLHSTNLSLGAEYSLVAISYHVGVGRDPRNHFASQLRVRGRWHRYDCFAGGIVTSSDNFDRKWHNTCVHMLVYLKSSLCIATPSSYTLQPARGSPSGRPRDASSPSTPSERPIFHTRDFDPPSPSGPAASGVTIPYFTCPISPSGRMC